MPTATVLGVVKDGSGAVVPDVALTARNVETGQSRTTVSGADGSYRFSALPVGTFELRAEHPGFQSEVRSGLKLTVSQEAVVNFSLQVGAIEQTIAVKADAPLVNTTSGSLGSLVDEHKVADLPLNGRNYIDLSLMQTGVTSYSNFSHTTAGMVGTWFSSSGAPPRSNNYLLDGAPMQNLAGASSASVSNSTLGVEGIREYRILTNSFTADYGMTMGSQVEIVTKSGTNSLHGTIFEYLRNSALDARNFFDYRSPATSPDFRLPQFKRNNFGGSVGGPIKKDKTFYFGVYEGLRERLGITTVSNVMPPGCHGGAGAIVLNTACSLLASTPSVTIAPQIAPLLALYPLPNLPNNLYTFPYTQPTTENYGQVRIDHTFSASDTIFGRYTVDDTEQVQGSAFRQFLTDLASRNQYSTLSENHMFSPVLLNTFRFSYSRTANRGDSPPTGLIGPPYSFIPGKEIGSIGIGAVTGLGPNGTTPLLHKQNIFAWSDDLFYTRGRHALKFGTLLNRYQQYLQVSTNNRGGISFANLASFLGAQPTTYNGVTPGSIQNRTYHYSTVGFYVQDNVRMLANLTLNLGLRYEFTTQYQEAKGHGAALRDIVHDATTTPGPPFENPTLKNFSPRFGFAWDVKGDGKTAVRGGFGLLYDIGNLGSALLVGVTATPPLSSLSTVTNPSALTLPLFFPPEAAGKSIRTVDYFIPQTRLLQYNLTIERQFPFDMALTAAYGGSRGINLIRTVEGNPTIPQILSDAREFWTGNEARRNPNWANIEFKTGGGNSWYNSLQLGLMKRLASGLQFQSAYTWSKVIDETQAQFGADTTTENSTGSDPLNRKTDRGVAVFDITQNWRFNAIYHLPALSSSTGATGKLLNGWWMSGILSLQSGYPDTIVLGSNRSRSKVAGGGAGIDRPDLVLGRSSDNIVSGTTAGCPGVAAGRKLGSPNLYFDPCAFTVPAAGFLGTAGRNIIRGPGLANIDFSLVKDTDMRFLGEGGKLEFRAEFFNILNRANFSSPNRTVLAGVQSAEPALSTAGLITTTSTTARQIQLALKILF